MFLVAASGKRRTSSSIMLASARWWHASSVHSLRKNDGVGAMLISTDAALETITLRLQEMDTKLKTQNERLREVLREQAEMETRIKEAISSCQQDQTEATNEHFQEISDTLNQILEEKREEDDDNDTMSTVRKEDLKQDNDQIRDELAQMSIKLSGEIEQIKSNYVALSQHVATLDNALVEELKAKQRERESMDKALARFAVGLGFVTLSLCSLAAFDWITRNSGTPL